MGVALWDDFVLESRPVYCHCCVEDGPCYGQVIVYDPAQTLAIDYAVPPCNANVIAKVDAALYKRRLAALLCSAIS
jgi:purine nucleosidase